MDMYSMGITFYEIATLRHPYTVSEDGNAIEAWMNAHFSQLPTNPNRFNKSLDPKLAQIIMKMISKRPEDRYASWDELIQRLTSDEGQKTQRRNVSSLIERAMATQRATEEARLIAESESRKEEEQRDLFYYCFKEIVDAATETVESFNSESEFIKLRIKGRGMGFSIYADKGGGELPTVSAAMVLARNVHIGDGQLIRAWGTVKAPSGKGFNLLLVARGNDDLYGRWQTLHVSHNPIANRRDARPEPFPFEIGELPKEMHLLNAMHIYQTTRGMFQADMLDPLLAELLDD